MGVVHFAGLGKSPGAVTCALSYLKNEYGNKKEEYGKIVEKVVIFTSEEIASGKEKAFYSVDNEYMKRKVQCNWAEKLNNSVKIVKEFIHREFKDVEIYLCIVDVNNFDECFEAVTKALLKFHPRGEVGKHIWANLTGGTNILNSALVQVAYLSGLIPVMYYTFVANMKEDGKYLKPFSRNKNEFYFKRINVFKTTFDGRFFYILEELNNIGDFIKDEELLSRLKGKQPILFENFNLRTFRRDYINIMSGWCIEKNDEKIKINEDGKYLLNRIKSPLISALIGREYPKNVEELIKDLNIKKI